MTVNDWTVQLQNNTAASSNPFLPLVVQREYRGTQGVWHGRTAEDRHSAMDWSPSLFPSSGPPRPQKSLSASLTLFPYCMFSGCMALMGWHVFPAILNPSVSELPRWWNKPGCRAAAGQPNGSPPCGQLFASFNKAGENGNEERPRQEQQKTEKAVGEVGVLPEKLQLKKNARKTQVTKASLRANSLSRV